jgi:hypothetical protein
MMSFSPETGEFVLEYIICETCKLPTEIYLNEDIYYPKGFNVTIRPSNVANWRQIDRNRIAVYNTGVGNVQIGVFPSDGHKKK